VTETRRHLPVRSTLDDAGRDLFGPLLAARPGGSVKIARSIALGPRATSGQRAPRRLFVLTVAMGSCLLGCGSPPPSSTAPPPSKPAQSAEPAQPPEPPAPPAPTASPAPSPDPLKFPGFNVTSSGELRLPSSVHFRTDKPDILPQSDAVLDEVRRFLEAFPAVTLLRIEAHTDNTGGRAHNLWLARSRALSVTEWLVAHGVDCKRLFPIGFGPDRPIACNDCSEHRTRQRRINFHIAMVQGNPPFGQPDAGVKPDSDPCNITYPPRP
jgi:OmpA-OmpF porin, OOP family